jgi:hypothetical protein
MYGREVMSMTIATLSVIPSTLFSTTMAGLLGPLSILALGAVGVALGVLVFGLLAESRDLQMLARISRAGYLVALPNRCRDDRAAA